jgi:hypothetical protein
MPSAQNHLMAIQLNPSKVPIWKTESLLRLGLGEDAQELGEVTNAQERLIHLLFEGVAENQISLIGNSVGLSNEETKDLVNRLRPSLIDSPRGNGQAGGNAVRLAELMRIGLTSTKSPAEVIGKRSKQIIEVTKLDRTGLTMIRALAEVGFKVFETKDFGLVSDSDLGELGYPSALHGVARVNAVRQLLEADNKKIEIRHENVSNSSPIICLLSAMHQVFPSEHRGKVEPLILIEYRLGSIFVSRVIQLGQDPCLSCRDLWSAEAQSTWTSESIQLAARGDQLDDGMNLLLASSIAVRNICAYVDGTSGANTLANIKDRGMREENWQRHESCGCLKV